MNSPAFVYFAKEYSTGLTKIGMSGDPESRMKTLSVERRSKIQLIGKVRVSRFGAFTFERFAQWQMIDKHVEGEWFLLDKDDIARVSGRLKHLKFHLKRQCPPAMPQLPWRRKKAA